MKTLMFAAMIGTLPSFAADKPIRQLSLADARGANVRIRHGFFVIFDDNSGPDVNGRDGRLMFRFPRIASGL
jgi:hypothetical protein